MIRILRTAAAIVASIGAALCAFATPYSIDFTDLWWNPDESGWGVNVVQQQDTLFATLFVYGADNSPRWFVASELVPASAPEGAVAFSGTLYQTSGPHFGAAVFDGSTVTRTSVGTMTLTFSSSTAGTLQYAIGGIAVTESVRRQTWRAHNLSGDYVGGLATFGTACLGPVGGSFVVSDRLNVVHEGDAVTMQVRTVRAEDPALRCVFTGTYSQAGRFGRISGGTWSCTFEGRPANQGVFALTEIDVGVNGFTSRFEGADQVCNYDRGAFGGVREIR